LQELTLETKFTVQESLAAMYATRSLTGCHSSCVTRHHCRWPWV